MGTGDDRWSLGETVRGTGVRDRVRERNAEGSNNAALLRRRAVRGEEPECSYC